MPGNNGAYMNGAWLSLSTPPMATESHGRHGKKSLYSVFFRVIPWLFIGLDIN
jgi:hypothetical protein